MNTTTPSPPSLSLRFAQWFGYTHTTYPYTCAIISSPFFTPLQLGLFRISLALICWAIIFTSLILRLQDDGFRWFVMLTNISFLSLSFYFTHAGALALMYRLSRHSHIGIGDKMSFWLQIQYQSLFAIELLVTIVYWAYLHRHQSEFTIHYFLNIATHGFPIPFLLLEFIFNYLDCFMIQMSWTLLSGLLYVCWMSLGSVLFMGKDGRVFWPYQILDPRKKGHELMYFVALGILIVGHSLLWILTILKWKWMKDRWINRSFQEQIENQVIDIEENRTNKLLP